MVLERSDDLQNPQFIHDHGEGVILSDPLFGAKCWFDPLQDQDIKVTATIETKPVAVHIVVMDMPEILIPFLDREVQFLQKFWNIFKISQDYQALQSDRSD